MKNKILFSIIAICILLAFFLLVVAAGAQDAPQSGLTLFLPLVANGSQPYPADGWVVTDIWVYNGVSYFKMINNGWEMTAMCTEPTVTPPPVGSVCTLNGDQFTCPGWQGSKIIKVVTTPTPTPTFTPVPTATNTPTPTFTPEPTTTACPLTCPAMNLRVEYPVGTLKYNVPFLAAPSMQWGALYRMYTGNETKLTFPVNGTVSAKIFCSGGTYNISSACADGNCKFGCGSFGYSQTNCDVVVKQTITTACGTIVCQAGFRIVDPIEDPLRFSEPAALPEVAP